MSVRISIVLLLAMCVSLYCCIWLYNYFVVNINFLTCSKKLIVIITIVSLPECHA